MKKTNFQLVQLASISCLAGLVLLVSGCGGGSGSTGVTIEPIYPNCNLDIVGTDNIAGCWVSEVCGSGGITDETWGAQGVRYLAWISEERISSTVTGAVEHYYLRYNNEQCTGTPFAIMNQQHELAKQGFEWVMNYEIPGFETCTDRADSADSPASILCTAVDLKTDFRRLGVSPGGESMAFGAYDTSMINSRLCLSGNMYTGFNPADADDFGIGPTGSMTRGTELDYLNCLTRFTP